jgi:hypothetical protein
MNDDPNEALHRRVKIWAESAIYEPLPLTFCVHCPSL